MVECINKFVFVSFYVNRSLAIIIFSFLIFCIISFICYNTPWPNFQDPSKGFETRNTEISNNLNILHYLSQNTYGPESYYFVKKFKKPKLIMKKVRNVTRVKRLFDKDPFCGEPTDGHSKLILHKKNKSSYFLTMKELELLCFIEETITNTSIYMAYCEKQNQSNTSPCCKSWTIPNYLFYLKKKEICKNLSLINISQLNFEVKCVTNNLTDPLCPSIKKKKWINSMLLANTDYQFRKGSKNLEYIMMYFSMAKGKHKIEVYEYILKNSKLYKTIQETFTLEGLDFGIDYLIFNKLIVFETLYVIIGLILAIFVLFLATQSFFFTLVSIYLLLFDLLLAFFIYKNVFLLSFFPFFNLLSVILLLATGIDQILLSRHIWIFNVESDFVPKKKKLRNYSYFLSSSSSDFSNKKMKERKVSADITFYLKNQFPSFYSSFSKTLFYTNLSTFITLFCLVFSKVLVLKSFAIFSCTLLFVNFFLHLILMPAFLLLHYNMIERSRKPFKKIKMLIDIFSHIIYNTIELIIFNYNWIIITIFALLLFLSSIHIYFSYDSLLEYNCTNYYFLPDHIFNKYTQLFDSEFKDLPSKTSFLDLHIFWGVESIYYKSLLDPSDYGTIKYNKSFNLFTKNSQIFLDETCKTLKNSNLFKKRMGLSQSICFTDWFKILMSDECIDIYNNNNFPCCKKTKFPYHGEIFKKCFMKYQSEVLSYFSSFKRHVNWYIGPRFEKSGKLIALVLEVISNHQFTLDYGEIKKFKETIEQLMAKINSLSNQDLGPTRFSSELMFFDLQHNIYFDSFSSFFVCLISCFFLCLFVSKSPIIAFFCFLNILTSIGIIFSLLIFFEWKLGIFECICICLTLGLSMDYTLHFLISFLTSKQNFPANISLVIKTTTVTMSAAMTTIVLALSLKKCKVLIYNKISTFLTILVLVTCFTTAFFFNSLLYRYAKSNKNKLPQTLKKMEKIEKYIKRKKLPNSTILNSAATKV